MATMKSKKGNPFERLVAYQFMLMGFDVNRIDDNTKGIDILVVDKVYKYAIECKFHKKFSWNEIKKVFIKTWNETRLRQMEHTPVFIFKSNQNPVLVCVHDANYGGVVIREFEQYYKHKITPIPRGYKVWKH